jgi:hypothetical protein
MRSTYHQDGTQTHDTEGATTVNLHLYQKLVHLVTRRHRILTGQDDLSVRTNKNDFTWAELKLHLPEIEADILDCAQALIMWSGLERKLGAHDPRFKPQDSVSGLHAQAERLKGLPPYLATPSE